MVEKGSTAAFPPLTRFTTPFGNPVFSRSSVNVAHGKRDALGWLEDKCVASRDGVGQIPERNHAGKVEGHDGGGDADGWRIIISSMPRAHIFEVVALHHHGNATATSTFSIARRISAWLRRRSCRFLRDDAGNVVEVIFEQHLQLEQWLDAVFGGVRRHSGKAAAAASTAWLTSLPPRVGLEPEFRRLRD